MATFYKGQRVYHASGGVGVILDEPSSGDDDRYHVEFLDSGERDWVRNIVPYYERALALLSTKSTRSDGVRRTKIARSTSGYCRICRGPHVYKHGRP